MKLTGKQKDKIAGILFDSNGHSGGCTQIISYVNTILKQSDNTPLPGSDNKSSSPKSCSNCGNKCYPWRGEACVNNNYSNWVPA